MFKASAGDGVAARAGVYRHALVRRMIPLLGPLDAGVGWSPVAMALAAVLMSWDPAPTLGQRFESALAVLDAALPRRRRTGRTYQGLVKALHRQGQATLESVVVHLREMTRRAAGACWAMGDLVPIGVDGSKFDAPRTIKNESLGLAGRDKCGPQMVVLLLVHLGSMIPWAWKIGTARESERSLLKAMLDLLPPNTLLVADAGFVGFDLLHLLREKDIRFLFRIGSNVNLLQELGFARREGKHTVYLWPNAEQAKGGRPPLVLRLIRLGEVHLITDVTDPKRLSTKAAGEVYRRRWGMEVAFRSLKQTLERRKVRSGAASNAKSELDWAVVGLWTLSLLGVQSIRSAGHPPRRLSLAATLTAVRAARLRPTTERKLAGRLRHAVQDRYRRRGSKRSYRYPHKKNPTPPGPPNIAIATPAQVRSAWALRSRRTAA